MEQIIEDLHTNGIYIGRMISGSKSMYRQKFPDHDVYFNANIITKEFGKIWWGDIDLTVDFDQLYDVAIKNNVTLYVLSELDGRFGNEKLPAEELINKAIVKIN